MTFTIAPGKFPGKFECSPLWILPKFSAIPPFGFLVTNDPQGINNEPSLICFAVIMQHASMAYHVQRAYKGPGIWLLRGGGGGGDGRGDLRKKYPEVWFWAQKSLTRKYLPYNSFVCRGRTFYDYQRFSGKTILTQTHEVTQITCRKSCYCLILRLRHQSLIVHSRSKLVHVYLLLHDECNAAGRLGTFFNLTLSCPPIALL